MRTCYVSTHKKHMDDRGAAMITVILTILIIMIMASSLLTMASMNYRMRLNNYKAKQNSYKTELALEKIRVDLRNDIQTAVQGSADKALTAYQYLKNPNNFSRFFTSYDAAAGDGGGRVTINADAAYLSYDATKTMLKNVDVVYTENGMKTHLTTDIVMEFPKIEKKAKLMDYSFIAMNGLEFKGGNVKKVTVHGNVYSKAGNSTSPALNLTYQSHGAEIIFTGDTVTIDGDVFIGKECTLSFTNPSGGNATVIINGKVTLQNNTSTLSISPSIKNLYIKDGIVANGGNIIPSDWAGKNNPALKDKVTHLKMDDVLAGDKKVKARVGDQEVVFDHFGYTYAKQHGQQDASHWIDPNQVMNGQGLEGENTTLLFSRTDQTIPINNNWALSNGKSLVGILINPNKYATMSFQVAETYAGMFISDSSILFEANNDNYEIMPYTQAHNMEDAMDKWIRIGQLNNKPVYVQLSALFADDLVTKLGAGSSASSSGGTQTNAVWVTYSNWAME